LRLIAARGEATDRAPEHNAPDGRTGGRADGRTGGRDRLRVATTAFRTFPFSSPSYLWKDVEAAPRTVAFNCLKCPVAEHFRAHDLSDVCVKTWCALDFPLARQWGATLERTGTIAGGAAACDFRWHATPDTPATPDPDHH